MKYRIEKDTIGEMKVPVESFWGCQTQRSLQNFPISSETIPRPVIIALTQLKKAAATANCKAGILNKTIKELITRACDRILAGEFDDQFPLVVWQTGSGTQTNMNVNEVISNVAITTSGGQPGSKEPVHPNDHVNKSQSSNDIFPAAMHMAAGSELLKRLIPALKEMMNNLKDKEEQWSSIIKTGRTHLQDAVPITLGQEFSGYLAQLELSLNALENSIPELNRLPVGGTAVGTGLNTPPGFDVMVCELVSEWTGISFQPAKNKFAYIAAHDSFNRLSGTLSSLAAALMKIANDIRWLGSGPRCGIGELTLPANEPGSSIMPGKVNPTQAEAMTMACAQVMGNHTTVQIACSQGNFELNVYKPVIIYNVLQSIRLLSDSMLSFTQRCLAGLEPDIEQINTYLGRSLMLVTALNPHIGYENSAKIAKTAFARGITLKEAALELELLTAKEFDKIIKPEDMV
jgi:fumarate hydratase class II